LWDIVAFAGEPAAFVSKSSILFLLWRVRVSIKKDMGLPETGAPPQLAREMTPKDTEILR